MAYAAIIRKPCQPAGIFSDGTSIYAACSDGRVRKITIADGTTVTYRRLNKPLTAITSDGTYLFVGTAHGELYKITINATLSLRVVALVARYKNAIACLHVVTTTGYIGFKNGQFASYASW